MKKTLLKFVAIAAILLFLNPGCSGINKITDSITNPSARDLYKRSLGNGDTAYNAWECAFKRALFSPVDIPLPYGEKGTFDAADKLVYTYAVNLQKGEMLVAEVQKDSVIQMVFIDILQQGTGQILMQNEPGHNTIEYAASETGKVIIVIQPEIAANSNFFIRLQKKPMYGFPVAGKGNAAIQSFWSDVRDGGKRSHEGIDIFAKRGTPVVAAVDGVVTFTGERGLGGKQVWERAGTFGNSIYYAHLDRIAVDSGDRVKIGDTLGFVGNTGNAKSTPPHLHFGIYGNYGAVDPLPFVYKTTGISAKAFPFNYTSRNVSIKQEAANLRSGPGKEYATTAKLVIKETLTVLGQHNDWLHIQTKSGQKAFLHKSLVKQI